MAHIVTLVGTWPEIIQMAPLAIGANVLAGTESSRVGAALRTRMDVPRGSPNPYGCGTSSRHVAGIVDRVPR